MPDWIDTPFAVAVAGWLLFRLEKRLDRMSEILSEMASLMRMEIGGRKDDAT